MSQLKKISIGIITGLAPVFFVAFMVFINRYGSAVTLNSPRGLLIFLMAFAVILYAVICICGYWRLVTDSKKVQQEKKQAWYMGLILFHVAVIPVYWYIFVWKEPQE